MFWSRLGKGGLGRSAPTDPPTIAAVLDRTHQVATELSLTFSGAVFDGSTPQWRLDTDLDGGVFTGNSPTANEATLVWTPGEPLVDTDVTITVSIADAGGRIATETIVVSVVPVVISEVLVSRITAVPDTFDLSADSIDWAMFARSSATDRDEKSDASEIGALTYIGDGTAPAFMETAAQIPALSWTGGTPTASSGTAKLGARVQWSQNKIGRGVRLVVNTSQTDARRLRVFAGGVSTDTNTAKIAVKAWMSGAPTVAKVLEITIAAGADFTPLIFDVDCPVGGVDETLVVELYHASENGAWRFKGAALYTSSTTNPVGLTLDKALTIPLHERLSAKLTYAGANQGSATLTADGLPKEAYFVDHRNATGTLEYSSAVAAAANPIATISFKAMNNAAQLASKTFPVVLSAQVLPPPVISWVGANWTFARNTLSEKTINFQRGTLRLKRSPSVAQLFPVSPGVAKLVMTMATAGSGAAYDITLEAIDSEGRVSTATLPVIVT